MKLNVFACSFGLSGAAGAAVGSDNGVNGRIQLFPFGSFQAHDGRVGVWCVDDSNGYKLAADINALNIELMIDYEHQTLYIAENGRGNPAAGWIVRAEYRSGEGLFADVRWTPRALSEIKNGEYRYISPLFLADDNGRVLTVLNAALTNRPALHNLAEAVATSAQFSYLAKGNGTKTMKEQLIKLFGLSDQATDAEIEAALTALSAAKGDSPVALKDVYGKLATIEAEKVALSAQVAAGAKQPDPSQYVALSQLQAVQTELNTLRQQVLDKEVNDTVTAALSDGRLLPAQKDWATALGKQNLTALSDFLKTVTPNPALNGMQSKGDPNEKTQKIALSAGEIAGAKALGLTPEEYAARYKTEEK